MGFYTQESFDLLCELVNRDNPELEVPFSRDTVVLLQGPLTTELGSSGRSTRAVFNGIQGYGANGKKTVFYDRIDLARLYGPSKIKLNIPADAITLKDLLPTINQTLGLNLTVTDLANPDLPLTGGMLVGTVTVTVAAKSLGYLGAFTAQWERLPIGTFPESGPGTKLLRFGSLEAGYFGTVPESELFNKIVFYNAVNDGTQADIGGVAAENSGYYFKFAYKNRFIFVPATPLVDNLSWLEIYNRGALYGPTQSEHLLQEGTPRVEQDQFIIQVREGDTLWQLKPKLAGASKVDPVSEIGFTGPNVGGEWFDLFRHTTKKGPSSTGAWDDKPELGEQAHYEWLMNTVSEDSNRNAFTFVPKQQTGAKLPKTGSTSRSRWRPIFEVVNDLNLLQGVKFNGTAVVGRLPSIVLNLELPPLTDRLAGVTNVKGTIDAPAPGPMVESYVDSMFPVKSISWETDAADSIGNAPIVTMTLEHARTMQKLQWTTYDLPTVTNISITR